MNSEKLTLLFSGIFIGILATLVYTNSITKDITPFFGSFGMNSRDIDRHFIEQMIPHHDGAIEMAELAKLNSDRPEILELADSIIESQTEENNQMRIWYRNWYGTNVEIDSSIHMDMGRGIMHGGMMGDDFSDIEALENAKDFDRAFLEEMIPHHQMAVMMAQMLLAGSERSEMKQLASDIISSQEAEIDLMQTWLYSWY